ncbi:glycoside hydrolase family 28 protein [Paenibacillus thalictri]|uniref:Glycoside hydrolase family 28 protein n=1 Tax=Paenibacillus thalictri TaxID=2527873 RepID=A0A4Q9DJI9_9BACL|nr:glycoside hydrolase family 28 protein [Paenibacillus thalictri]TBL71603.1 glycoside hydrolase family 28 protein [Paenibacillus thalictri]
MSYHVKQFGAAGDGQTLDHGAIQSAIDECSRSGGGTVVLPGGTYLCGTIHLRSNVCLHLEMGAVILGAGDGALYPEICKTPYGNLPGQIQALIWADGVENVSITGEGTIDGGGASPLPPAVAAGVKFRPALVFYRDCKNVKFLDVTLQYSCFWTLHLMRCEEVMVRGVTILANMERINTDGIDPDGCRNMIISDCNIQTGDDCIVIKSTEGDPCENITVANCILSSRHAALKIGTEAVGPIRNVTFNNCIIHHTDVALALYMKDGSIYENMVFSNMVIEARNEFPILLDVTPRYYKEPKIGRIRNVTFDNVTVTGQGRCYIEGVPGQPIENVRFRNVTWNVTGPCRLDQPSKPPGARRVEIDPQRVNYAVHPYQFIAAYVDGLLLRDIRIRHESAEGLPDRGGLYAEQVRGVIVEHLDAPPGLEPTVVI